MVGSAALADDYRDRETAAMMNVDQCGPSFLTDNAPASFGSAVSGAFRPACQRHDACYRLGEQTQKWCDDQFGADLLAICSDEPAGFRDACETRASLFEALVRTTFGANSFGASTADQMPAGAIQSVRAEFKKSLIFDDEITICVRILNDSKVTQEYDVELYTEAGERVDREPDSHELNVEAGAVSEEICVGTTDDPRWSLEDLGQRARLHLRADTPRGFAVTDDMVTVDVKEIDLPGR